MEKESKKSIAINNFLKSSEHLDIELIKKINKEIGRNDDSFNLKQVLQCILFCIELDPKTQNEFYQKLTSNIDFYNKMVLGIKTDEMNINAGIKSKLKLIYKSNKKKDNNQECNIDINKLNDKEKMELVLDDCEDNFKIYLLGDKEYIKRKLIIEYVTKWDVALRAICDTIISEEWHNEVLGRIDKIPPTIYTGLIQAGKITTKYLKNVILNATVAFFHSNKSMFTDIGTGSRLYTKKRINIKKNDNKNLDDEDDENYYITPSIDIDFDMDIKVMEKYLNQTLNNTKNKRLLKNGNDSNNSNDNSNNNINLNEHVQNNANKNDTSPVTDTLSPFSLFLISNNDDLFLKETVVNTNISTGLKVTRYVNGHAVVCDDEEDEFNNEFDFEDQSLNKSSYNSKIVMRNKNSLDSNEIKSKFNAELLKKIKSNNNVKLLWTLINNNNNNNTNSKRSMKGQINYYNSSFIKNMRLNKYLIDIKSPISIYEKLREVSKNMNDLTYNIIKFMTRTYVYTIVNFNPFRKQLMESEKKLEKPFYMWLYNEDLIFSHVLNFMFRRGPYYHHENPYFGILYTNEDKVTIRDCFLKLNSIANDLLTLIKLGDIKLDSLDNYYKQEYFSDQNTNKNKIKNNNNNGTKEIKTFITKCNVDSIFKKFSNYRQDGNSSKWKFIPIRSKTISDLYHVLEKQCLFLELERLHEFMWNRNFNNYTWLEINNNDINEFEIEASIRVLLDTEDALPKDRFLIVRGLNFDKHLVICRSLLISLRSVSYSYVFRNYKRSSKKLPIYPIYLTMLYTKTNNSLNNEGEIALRSVIKVIASWITKNNKCINNVLDINDHLFVTYKLLSNIVSRWDTPFILIDDIKRAYKQSYLSKNNKNNKKGNDIYTGTIFSALLSFINLRSKHNIELNMIFVLEEITNENEQVKQLFPDLAKYYKNFANVIRQEYKNNLRVDPNNNNNNNSETSQFQTNNDLTFVINHGHNNVNTQFCNNSDENYIYCENGIKLPYSMNINNNKNNNSNENVDNDEINKYEILEDFEDDQDEIYETISMNYKMNQIIGDDMWNEIPNKKDKYAMPWVDTYLLCSSKFVDHATARIILCSITTPNIPESRSKVPGKKSHQELYSRLSNYLDGFKREYNESYANIKIPTLEMHFGKEHRTHMCLLMRILEWASFHDDSIRHDLADVEILGPCQFSLLRLLSVPPMLPIDIDANKNLIYGDESLPIFIDKNKKNKNNNNNNNNNDCNTDDSNKKVYDLHFPVDHLCDMILHHYQNIVNWVVYPNNIPNLMEDKNMTNCSNYIYNNNTNSNFLNKSYRITYNFMKAIEICVSRHNSYKQRKEYSKIKIDWDDWITKNHVNYETNRRKRKAIFMLQQNHIKKRKFNKTNYNESNTINNNKIVINGKEHNVIIPRISMQDLMDLLT